jgi:hypothetical protein
MNTMPWDRAVAMRFLECLGKSFVRNHDPTIEEAYSSSLNTVSETERLKSNPIPTSFNYLMISGTLMCYRIESISSRHY